MKKHTQSCIAAILFGLAFLTGNLHAQVPNLINYQGKVAVGTVNFDSATAGHPGQFKFALVDGTGNQVWRNEGTGAGEPATSVPLTVTKGLYSVLLGDTIVPNMAAIPTSLFSSAVLRLRVWFNDGTANGFQLLSPDQRLAPTAYLADGAVTTAKLAPNAVGSAQLAPGTVFSWQPVSGTSQTAQANTGYTAGNAAQTTITLPATANVGDVVQVMGVGGGGWSIAPNAGQSVLGGSAAGTSWTPHGPQRNWYRLASSADGGKLIAAVNNEYLYGSTDGGNTWNQLPTSGSRTWSALASSSDGSKLIGVVVSGFVYTSGDSGSTWTARLTDQGRGWKAVASSGLGNKLVAAAPAYGIYTSTDSGATWTPRAGTTAQTWSSLASSDDGVKLVAVANGSQIYTSADSGATWTPHGVSAAYNSVASSNDGTKLVATVSGGQIYTSADSGATWTAHESARAWFGVASSASGANLVAVVYGGQVHTSTDSGLTWTPRDTTRNWICVASSANGSSLAAGVDGNDRIYTSKQYLTGAQGSTAQLQYIGNGQWQTMNQSLIAMGAVGTGQIAGGAVGNAQLAANAVQAANIAAGAVGAPQLANGSIGAAQLAAAAVTSANIAPGAIGGAQIAPNALTGLNISIPLTLSGAPSFGLAKTEADETGSGLYVILGENTASGIGVKGTSVGGDGIFGSSGKNGVHGQSASTTDSGVWGENTGSGKGVWGSSTNGIGVYGQGASWAGFFLGNVNVTSGLSAKRITAETSSISGNDSAVYGFGYRTGSSFTAARGVFGESDNNDGVYGLSSSGTGVSGESYSGWGLKGISNTWDGVHGESTSSTGVYGHSDSGIGVFGNSESSRGVFGMTMGNDSEVAGVWAEDRAVAGGTAMVAKSFSTDGTGIYAFATGANSNAGYFDGNVFVKGTATVKVLRILGADVAEPFDIAEPELPKGTVVVIDGERLGGLKRSTHAYDKRAAGIVSGANGVRSGIILSQPGVNEGGQNVAISGRVYVQADASNGPIKPGDMLTTSDIPGHAMKATDHDRAQGAIIGKAMSTLDMGTGMVLVLVTLQ